MGGKSQETDALLKLEKQRQKLMDRCVYTNEKNWVTSITCMNRISLSKVLFYDQMIKMIIEIPGVILELGVQWGATTNLLYNLTAIHEPYNFRRKVVGFDTFEGFPESSLSEGEKAEGWKANDLKAASDSMEIADQCLKSHQVFSAMDHMVRHEYVKGDVIETLPSWLNANEHETVALCIFDMDLGIPTRESLKHVLPRCQKGTVLVFDEYSHPRFKEEGIAARELLNIHDIRPRKSTFLPYTSFFVL